MKKRISKEDLKRVKQLDLLNYLLNYEPDELIKVSNKEYRLRTNDSITLSNGMWYRHSQKYGKKSALDYFIYVRNYDFLDAALHLLNLINQQNPQIIKQEYKKSKSFRLPLPNSNNNIAIQYLTQIRKIDVDIINYFINHYYIYESAYDHAVVFVGYDEECQARFATKRSTNTKDKKDVFASNKEYSFNLSNLNNQYLHIFESAIDLLSFLTIQKISNKDYLNENYLSLSGVDGGNFKIIHSYLNRNKQIKLIYLHLDNDDTGNYTTGQIKSHFQSKYNVLDKRIDKGKDINDQLISLLNYRQI